MNCTPKELNSEILDESIFLGSFFLFFGFFFWLLYKDSIVSETQGK